MSNHGASQLKRRKICVMGYSRVGKSSLTIQFVNNNFPDSYEPTIASTFIKRFQINNVHYSLEVMDTAGQDEYSIMSSGYDGMDGYILVYDITNRKSFEVCHHIFDKLLEMKGESSLNHVPIVLVGNMKDLHTRRVIPTDEGQRQAQEWHCGFIESSAKNNENIRELFEMVIKKIDTYLGISTDESRSNCSTM